eukprot:COSAG01_NODE_70249_length_259_cov_0.643750_1_plen_45_part_10
MERARRSELRDVRCFLDLFGRMPTTLLTTALMFQRAERRAQVRRL